MKPPVRLLLMMLLAHAAHPCAAWPQEAGAAGAVQVYEAHGVLKAYDPATRQATIAHDAIPGYMQAMTMAFEARDPDDFAGLSRGDIVSFHLCVMARTAWIDHVVRTGVSSHVLDPPGAAPARELVPGDPAPDVELTDQAGKTIHLSDFRGKAVAITFIYTGCPLPTYCPLMTQNFFETQDLMTRMGAGDNWRLLSISMDPVHDTPRVLSLYAAANHADPARWDFATGDQAKVGSFGAAYGLEYQQTSSGISHNLRTVVLDPAGRIRSVYSGNAWTPQQLVADLRAAMRHEPPPAPAQ